MNYTLEYLARTGQIMGLATIGEVASHMELHYDAYFLISDLPNLMIQFDALVTGHEHESIDVYLSAEDKAKIDAELDEVMEREYGPIYDDLGGAFEEPV